MYVKRIEKGQWWYSAPSSPASLFLLFSLLIFSKDGREGIKCGPIPTPIHQSMKFYDYGVWGA